MSFLRAVFTAAATVSLGLGCVASSTSLDPTAADHGAGDLAGPACTADVDCNHGATGLGIVCATSGSDAQTCIEGCHGDGDCASGHHCDTTASPHYVCSGGPPPIGSPCSSDATCNLGQAGTERVCGSSTSTCIIACHASTDCPSGTQCDESSSPWECAARRRRRTAAPC